MNLKEKETKKINYKKIEKQINTIRSNKTNALIQTISAINLFN